MIHIKHKSRYSSKFDHEGKDSQMLLGAGIANTLGKLSPALDSSSIFVIMRLFPNQLGFLCVLVELLTGFFSHLPSPFMGTRSFFSSFSSFCALSSIVSVVAFSSISLFVVFIATWISSVSIWSGVLFTSVCCFVCDVCGGRANSSLLVDSRQNDPAGSNGFSCTFGFFFACPFLLQRASCPVLHTSRLNSITCLPDFGSTVIVFSFTLIILRLTLLKFPSSYVPYTLSRTSMVEPVSSLQSSDSIWSWGFFF